MPKAARSLSATHFAGQNTGVFIQNDRSRAWTFYDWAEFLCVRAANEPDYARGRGLENGAPYCDRVSRKVLATEGRR